MKGTRLTVPVAAAMVLSLLLASTALASGPATSHRGTVTADCGGQTYTVAVVNSGKNIGAAQIVGAFGHAILVHGTFTVTDVEAGKNIVIGGWESFHGVGHDKQEQTLCVVIETGEHVSDFMTAADLPTGVFLTDAVEFRIDFWVVLKV